MKVALWVEWPILLLGFKTQLQQSEFEVGAESSTDLQPTVNAGDILIVHLPGALEKNTLRIQQACNLGVRVVLVLNEPAPTNIPPILVQMGVAGLLLADAKDLEIRYCIDEVAAGRRMFSQRAIPGYDFSQPSRPRQESPLALLSRRERQVFAGLTEGKKAKDIARELGISPKTVDTYRASMLRKLGLRDIVELVRFADKINTGVEGLLTQPPHTGAIM